MFTEWTVCTYTVMIEKTVLIEQNIQKGLP